VLLFLKYQEHKESMTYPRTLTMLSACMLFCLCSNAARAQTSVYGAVTLTNYGFYTGNGSSINFKGAAGGLTGGVLYDFPIKSRLHAGIDARGSYTFGNKGGGYGGVALRIAFVPTHVRLRPYFELGGGFVSSSTGFYSGRYAGETGETNAQTTNGAAILLFGLDVRVNSSFDVRAIEYGAAAGGSSQDNVGVSILDAGVVYHLPHKH
jgi:hypothetical protein